MAVQSLLMAIRSLRMCIQRLQTEILILLLEEFYYSAGMNYEGLWKRCFWLLSVQKRGEFPICCC